MNTRYMKRLKTDLVVVGGGAAGMIAAISAAERGAKRIADREK
jgi:succinate dehydrogenase/fumarate reductase flavoprotein subunit